MKLFFRCLLAATILLTPAALAQEKGKGEEKSGEEFHRHHFAGLLADSHNTEKNGFTCGGEYEFRPKRLFGVAVTGEFVGGGFREDLWAFTADFHPWKGLRFQVGPGFEQELKKHSTEAHASEGEHGKSVRGLFRVGAGYEWEIGKRWSIGPDFAFDMLKGEHVFVYGVTIGFGFGGK